MVGDTLRRMSRVDGTTSLCTIHQPRASLLAVFDVLLILAEGCTAYFGPVGLRLDGRRPKEIRQLKADLGVLQSDNRVGIETFEEVLALAQQGCGAVATFMRETLLEHVRFMSVTQQPKGGS